MDSSRRTWIGLAIIALVALFFVTVPGGGEAGELVMNFVHAGFLVLIGVSLLQLYRQRASWLAELPDRDRGVLYGAVSIAALSIVGVERFRSLWDGGIVLLIVVLAACGFAIYQVWSRSQQWSV